MKFASPRLIALFSGLFVLPLAYSVDAPAATAPAANTNPNNLGKDAHGNPLRRAPRTGHISNYDENKVGQYTLPDPLILANGQRIDNADTWLNQRRPEILKLYQSQFYGRVPDSVPAVTFAKDTDESVMLNDTAVIHRHGVVTIGEGERAVHVNVHYYLPPHAKSAVPVLLHLTFATNTAGPATAPATASGPARPSEAGPIADILGRGFGYALVRYTEIQPDNADTHSSGVQALAYKAGQTQPQPDEWGTVATWAWGVSRVLDFLATDSAIDAKRIALMGHSRLGKTALWAGASDPRFALIFSSCAGEMGSSLARRDYGESLDDMTGNFGWQFAGNLQQYAGRWNDLPVDAHMLIALSAPRPVFITGGTEDQWADPKGEFLAEVAAGPVYRLLGKKDLGTTELPPLDTPLIEGDLGFHYHTGGHTITASDWKAFLTFATRHLNP
ncbi:MAG: acetylxylan esterase [Opitutus sp.]